MTLDQQVHQHEIAIIKLKQQVWMIDWPHVNLAVTMYKYWLRASN
jgi:hypothetical protein